MIKSLTQKIKIKIKEIMDYSAFLFFSFKGTSKFFRNINNFESWLAKAILGVIGKEWVYLDGYPALLDVVSLERGIPGALKIQRDLFLI